MMMLYNTSYVYSNQLQLTAVKLKLLSQNE